MATSSADILTLENFAFQTGMSAAPPAGSPLAARMQACVEQAISQISLSTRRNLIEAIVETEIENPKDIAVINVWDYRRLVEARVDNGEVLDSARFSLIERGRTIAIKPDDASVWGGAKRLYVQWVSGVPTTPAVQAAVVALARHLFNGEQNLGLLTRHAIKLLGRGLNAATQ